MTLLIVDDHAAVRKGLAMLIAANSDIEVVAECGLCSEAEALALAHKPGLALIDLRLPDGDGVELCQRLKLASPGIKTAIITAFPGPKLIESAMKAGVDGVLLKTIDAAGIMDALRRIVAGAIFIDPSLGDYIAEGLMEGASRLTASDDRLLALLARGYTNKEIATELAQKEKTIRNRLSELYKKIHVGNRTEAALYVSGTFVPDRRD